MESPCQDLLDRLSKIRENVRSPLAPAKECGKDCGCNKPCPGGMQCHEHCIDKLDKPFLVGPDPQKIEFCDPESAVGFCFELVGSNDKRSCIRVASTFEKMAIVEVLEGEPGDLLEGPVSVYGPFKCPAEQEDPCAAILSRCPFLLSSFDDCILIRGNPSDGYSVGLDIDALCQKLSDIGCLSTPTDARVKGQVWFDFNADGDPSGENPATAGIPGATINVCPQGTTTIVASGVTSASGFYDFAVPPGGPYDIKIDEGTLPPDANTPGTTPSSYATGVLAAGDCVPDSNFGYTQKPTPVAIEGLCKSSNTVELSVGSEQGVLGYNILCYASDPSISDGDLTTRPPGATVIGGFQNATGSSFYAIMAVGAGNCPFVILEVVDQDLSTTFYNVTEIC